MAPDSALPSARSNANCSGRGCTFKSLQDAARLRAANSMLERSALAIADIAQRIGFDDPAHFTWAHKGWTRLLSVVRTALLKQQPSSLRTLRPMRIEDIRQRLASERGAKPSHEQAGVAPLRRPCPTTAGAVAPKISCLRMFATCRPD